MSDSINYYFTWANRHPLLTRDEERVWGKQAQVGDRKAINKLIISNLKLAVKIANQFSGYFNDHSISLEDLIQQGNLGLMKAAEKYDPDICKFSSYAGWWIRSLIQVYIVANYSIIKMGTTTSSRALFFKRGKFVEMVLSKTDQVERAEARKKFANDYGIDMKYVLAFEKRVQAFDVSMDKPTFTHKEASDTNNLHSFLGEDSTSESAALHSEMRSKVGKLLELSDLDIRERYIIKNRSMALPPKKLQEIGKVFSISKERVRQLEVRALKKLKVPAVEMGLEAYV